MKLAIRITVCIYMTFVLANFDLQAQAPALQHFSVEDGLPGGIVYYTIQDRDGYIWSATERGLCRFDGHQFKIFTIKDGLPSNDIWRISEDDRGRLWFGTFKEICYYEDGEIKTLKSELLPSGIEKVEHHITPYYHIIIVKTKVSSCYLLDKENNLIPLREEDVLCFEKKIILFENSLAAPVFKKHRDSLRLTLKDSIVFFDDIILVTEEKEAIKESLHFLDKNYNRLHFETLSPSKVVFIGFNKLWVYDIESRQVVNIRKIGNLALSGSIINVEKIANDRLWIKADDKNYIVNAQLQLAKEFDFLRDLPIHFITKDKQCNLWLSSRRGLFFLNQKALTSKTYDVAQLVHSESINNLAMNHQKELWGLGAEGYLYKLIPDTGLKLMSSTPVGQNVTDLIFDDDGNLWVGGDELALISKNKLISKSGVVNLENSIDNIGNFWAVKKMALHPGGFITLLSAHFIRHIYPKSDHKIQNILKGRYYGLAIKQNGDYWISGKYGLKLLDINGNEKPFPTKDLNPIFKLSTDHIVLGKKEELWMAVNSRGLFCFHEGRLDSIPELDHRFVQSLYVDERGRLWVASNQGLAKIETTQLNPIRYSLEWFTKTEGLTSNNIKDILVDDENIYISTEKGLTVLKDEIKISPSEYAPFHFSNLQVNGINRVIQKTYRLNHQQNNIRIEYQCLDYQNMGAIGFEYQLEGVDKDWVKTSDFYKEYPLLPPGDYTFRLRRQSNISSTDAPELAMQITIQKPWWKRFWFLALLLSSLGLLTYLGINLKLNQLKKQSEEKNKINKKFAELELNALQSQMNPHFVFNALQAIQDYIFKKDEYSANHYLVKFSRLIRLFLESSSKKYIVLQDEIQLLQLYIELEQMRFETTFSFEIDIEPQLPVSTIEIPSMLLQPFVENAINHGLVHHPHNGKLSLSFSQSNGKLYCRIEDNGIGRRKARAMKEASIKKNKSRGIQLVKERKKMLNIIGHLPINVSIEDLYNEDGSGAGTLVEVVIQFDD